MRSLDMEGREKYVSDKLAERQKIQAQIEELNRARQAYVMEKKLEATRVDDQTLDLVVTQTVREQASKKGYLFGKN